MSDKISGVITSTREKAAETANEKIEELTKMVHQQQEMIDAFVHEKPYKAVGIAALVGIGIGFICGSWMKHRRD